MRLVLVRPSALAIHRLAIRGPHDTDSACVVAPYLKHIASYTGEETPVVEYEDDIDNLLPPMPSAAGLKIKIPSSIMPGDEIANRYIDLYFIHIRPYVPALSQVQFEQQWRTSRNSISPLILEAMFAMGAGISEASGERHRWLALVSRKRPASENRNATWSTGLR